MASLQPYQSHGRRYYRIVESFRQNGKPHIRVLAHLGRVEDILRLHQNEQPQIRVASLSAGAVTALYHLAEEFDVVGRINRALQQSNGRIQKRDGLTVGESLLAGIISRACAPRSKRAFADWAQSTHLPKLMGFAAPPLTSEHFWEQMHALPVKVLGDIEHELVREVIRTEQLQVQALAYDTTNFYTHIACTNLRPQLPRRGPNKQGRHDLRQLGLALVVDQITQLPLAHALYEGARSDMRTFSAFLKPIRQRLRELSGPPQQLTLVFDAGACSKENLDSLDPVQDRYVTAVRPSHHQALLAEAVDQLAEVILPNQMAVRAWRTRRLIAGQERDAVVVFSLQLYEGQLRGLHQYLERARTELEQMGLQPRTTAEATKRKLAKICGRQYLRTVLRSEVSSDECGATQVRVWCDLDEYRRLTTRYFGLRILITDRSEWSTAEIVAAYRGLSRAEAAFQDLKDPGMTRIRSCRIVDRTGRAGRPRVRQQLEEMPPELHTLGEQTACLAAVRLTPSYIRRTDPNQQKRKAERGLWPELL